MGWYAEVVVNSIGFWGEFLGKTVEMASIPIMRSLEIFQRQLDFS